jgi:hypothetical protein
MPSGWTREGNLELPEPLQDPADLSLDPLGRILVLDSSSGKIWLLRPREGRPPVPFGAADQGSERFEIPTRVFARWDLHAYTLDPQLRALSVFDLEGRYEATFDLEDAISAAGGPRDVEFSDFVVDKDGSLIALDRLRGRLLAFDSEGLYRRLLGEDLTGGERLVSPTDLELDGDGTLFVADPPTGRVVRVSRQGSLIGSWSLRTAGRPGSRPVALSFSSGVLYVADAAENRLVALGPGGEILLEIALQDGEKLSPSSRIALTDDGKILLLQPGSRHILVFQLEYEPPER